MDIQNVNWMGPKTIRWQLPISYALIALLATLLLSTILLVTLSNYYQQRELEYLRQNAQEIVLELRPLLTLSPPPETLATYFSGLSLFSETRVALFDPQHNLIADTGPPRQAQDQFAVSLELPETSGFLDFVQNIDEDIRVEIDTQEDGETVITQQNIEAPGLEIVRIEKLVAPNTVVSSEQIITQSFTVLPKQSTVDSAIFTDTIISGTRRTLVSRLPRTASMFDGGFGVFDLPTTGVRSNQAVEMDIVAATGELLGYIEISLGPAYGRDIVQSVAIGSGIAGIIAVFLAAGVGWLVSQRISRPLLTLTEVTSQMAMGDLSARANVNHQGEIGQLGQSFNKMADQVENTVTTLRHFVADAAHEIRTPLTALRTNIEILASEYTDKTPQLARIQSQVTRLETLTNNLLELAQLENQSVSTIAPLEPILLNQLLAELAEMYGSQAEQVGIDFDVQRLEQPTYVLGNKPQLSKAIGNLLDNALKFSSTPGSILLYAQIKETHVYIYVEDMGIGIPTEDLPHLFDRFRRARNAVSYEGNGLGLAITKNIIETHSGTISAENTNNGSRFIIILPRQ